MWGIDAFFLHLLLTVAAFLAVLEVGFRLGYARRRREDDTAKVHVSALQTALLGLLALLLGFTFAMAVARFDKRKALVLDEANAIGTVYQRIQFMPAWQQPELVRLVKIYADARLEFWNAGLDDARLQAAQRSAAHIHGQLWSIAVAASTHEPQSQPYSLFAQSLNALMDVNEQRRVALDNRVPDVVLILLYAVSWGALGFMAYGNGLSGRRRWWSTTLFAALIALVLTTVVDMDRPRQGLILVSQDSLIRMREALEQ